MASQYIIIYKKHSEESEIFYSINVFLYIVYIYIYIYITMYICVYIYIYNDVRRDAAFVRGNADMQQGKHRGSTFQV